MEQRLVKARLCFSYLKNPFSGFVQAKPYYTHNFIGHSNVSTSKIFNPQKNNFMKKIQILIAITSLLFATSCKKSANGSAAMEYQIQTVSNSALILAPLGAGNITWTTGTASATMIKLEAKNSASQEVEFKSQVHQQIDLFASVATSLGNVVIPPGTYSEVEFKIQIDQDGSNPALQLNGLFTSGTGVATRVQFLVNSLVDIKAEQSNVTITDNASATALTSMNLSLLSNGITQTMMNNATVTRGTIIISSSSNVNLYNIILNNLIQSHDVEVHHH